jgi:acetyltransferase-like isoleucine patch superfamily enzyme
MIEIHATARVSPMCDIEDSVRGTRIVVGAHSVIDSFVKIKPAGGVGDVLIGEHSTINSGCVLYSGHGIRIGDHVAIAANTTLAPVNHAFDDRARRIDEQGFLPSRGGIVIEDDVWIGANCVLLDGAVLRRGCVIGAGSLVRGEVAPYTVHAGNPLVQRGERTLREPLTPALRVETG